MFNKPFSFKGRIRRTEYGISLIVFMIFYVFVSTWMESAEKDGESTLLIILMLVDIIVIWFIWAQGAKRCHDYGKLGWHQLIPFYPLFMIFRNGDAGDNGFGPDPKAIDNDDIITDDLNQNNS